MLAQALTNGYCAIPTVAGPCPHPNACLNCAHFRTDITFLDVHRAELRETERVIAKADANGWTRQSEMNAAQTDEPGEHHHRSGGDTCVRNTEGLKRSAKLRTTAALERAQTAIRRMQAEETAINFRTVAAQAGVSTAWLYNTKPLRDRIMKLRDSLEDARAERYDTIDGSSRRNE